MGETIPPPISSGVSKMLPYIMSSLSFLLSWYLSLLYLFSNESYIRMLPTPAEEFCTPAYIDEKGVCQRPDMFVFQLTSVVAFSVIGPFGFYIWYISRTVHTQIPSTSEGRLFAYLPEAELLAAINFSYQLFDFVVSLSIPEHRTPVLMAHHFLAATVSFCSVRYQYLDYYGIFFLGLSEVSSVFLSFVDLARFFPPPQGSLFDQFVGLVCGPLFVLSFVWYRIILWWPQSYQLFQDARSVLKSGRASELRPGAEWVLYLFLCINLPLGILQLYWSTIIFTEAQKVLFG